MDLSHLYGAKKPGYLKLSGDFPSVGKQVLSFTRCQRSMRRVGD